MAINFLDNLDLNDNQLLNARLQNLASDPTSANAGDIIFNTTSGKLKYYDGTSPFSASGWISVPDGTGIGGSGTVNTIPVFTSTGEIGDSRLETSGQTSSATFTFQTTGLTTFVGDVKVSGYLELAAGLKDKDGDLGTSGQLLSSTGTATNWINAPVSYTSWGLSGDSGSGSIVDGSQVTISGTNGITTSLINPTGNIFVLSSNLSEATSTTRGGIELFSNTDQLVSANSVSATANRTYGIQLNPIGQAVVNVPWTNTNTNTTYTLPTSVPAGNVASITLTGSDSSLDVVNFVGATNQTKINAATQGAITIGLADNVSTVGDLTVGGGDIILSGTGRIQGVDTVSAGTDAVNKTYVDNAVVGNLVFQGGYDAANNTPDLDSNPSSSIKKGWAYVVTDPGSFFTETVEVGDFLIAQQDAPTALANWVTVQNNIGLATTTTPGIASFAAANFEVSAAGAVTLADTAVSAATYGTAAIVPVIAVNDKGQITSATNTSISITASQVSDINTRIQGQVEKREFTTTNSGSGTSHVFTHSLNTKNVMVQIVDTSTHETVFAKVDRTSVNAVTVTTASSISAGAIRALITKIG